MEHQALYRRYRPAGFAGVVEQDHIISILKRQIVQQTMAHAYLFCGTRGTGKTSTARIFARALNCKKPQDGEPCQVCEICRMSDEALSVDINEMDAASHNGVDDIRDIRDKASYAPVLCTYKVYIIDEVHMLSGAAFNALLKTLEEPPAHVKFILATTEPGKIPATVLSRCQRYDFKRIPTQKIAQYLGQILQQEGREAKDEALTLIAQAAQGSMRDGLSVLDQCLHYSDGALTTAGVIETLGTLAPQEFHQMVQALQQGDITQPFATVLAAYDQGKDMAVLANDLLEYLCDALFAGGSSQGQTAFLTRAVTILGETINGLRTTQHQKALLLAALVRIARVEEETTPEALLVRIEALEQQKQNPRVPQIAPVQYAPLAQEPTMPAAKDDEDMPPWETADAPAQDLTEEPLQKTAPQEKPAEEVAATLSPTEAQKPPEDAANQDAFALLLTALKEESVPLYTMMSKGFFVEETDDELIIGFEKKDELAIRVLNTDTHKSLIDRAVEKAFGAKRAARFVVHAYISPPILEQAKEVFGMEIEMID